MRALRHGSAEGGSAAVREAAGRANEAAVLRADILQRDKQAKALAVSAEAQRTVEKRDKRRSRVDVLVFVTSAVVFIQAIAMSVYFVLGKL